MLVAHRVKPMQTQLADSTSAKSVMDCPRVVDKDGPRFEPDSVIGAKAEEIVDRIWPAVRWGHCTYMYGDGMWAGGCREPKPTYLTCVIVDISDSAEWL